VAPCPYAEGDFLEKGQLMSFYDSYAQYKEFDLDTFFLDTSFFDIERAMQCEKPEVKQFISFLSPKAENYMEDMAQRAHEITLRYFGRSMQLYTPMYVSNYCQNQCLYCGFNSKNNVARKKLSLEEVKKEAECIAATGLKHILILTGESRVESPVSYIRDCIKILRQFFSLISVEVYALTEDEYLQLVSEGAEGLTLYQEVYDQKVYGQVHSAGPKKDYRFRLDAPERGAKSGMRNINIGVLLGLAEWRKEAFCLGMHAEYLQDKFPDVEIGVSVPRIRPHTGDFKAACEVNDKNLVQIILALRNFLPRLGITVSTREAPELRENLLPLGVTRMSAGSTTSVGGHTLAAHENCNSSQFEISDKRNVDEIKSMLERRGYQAVLKDWVRM
jgi:2-iminoacetate synthase